MLYCVELLTKGVEVVTLCETNSFAVAKSNYLAAIDRKDGRTAYMRCSGRVINRSLCGQTVLAASVRPSGC